MSIAVPTLKNKAPQLSDLVLRSIGGGKFAFHTRIHKMAYQSPSQVRPDTTMFRWYTDNGYDAVTPHGAKTFDSAEEAHEWLFHEWLLRETSPVKRELSR